MATSIPTICSVCNSTNMIVLCTTCSKHFCFDHLTVHRENIIEYYNQVTATHDQLRQQINDLQIDPRKYSLTDKIDRWEEDSINKIKQLAQRCRAQCTHYSNVLLRQLEDELNYLAKQIKDVRQNNQLNEMHLNDLKQGLEKLENELNQATLISIRQQFTSFINKMSLLVPIGKKQCPHVLNF